MPRLCRFVAAALLTTLAALAPVRASALELTGRVAAELRLFPETPLNPVQHGHNASFVFAPELYQDWDGGRQLVVLAPFFRLDQGDPERTHGDLREAYWQFVGGSWEFSLGLRRVFWGVTESAHLVDIINQTDGVENPDGEDKLGQPMLSFGFFQDFGNVEAFLMPFHRERTAPGPRGRLRPPLPLGEATYESAAGNTHLDWALRWSHYISIWDFGLSHFSGTTREPRFVPGLTPSGEPALIPHYELIEQTGVDVQATTGGWLWKLEAFRRAGQGPAFIAVVGGFEYTLVQILGTPLDLGLVAEYVHDGREPAGAVLLDNDLFLGGRFVFNDVQSTEMLAGVITDLETGGSLLSVEAARRFGDRWRLEVELRAFANATEDPLLTAFSRDDYLQIELQRFY
jgi:hypothetical protein